MSEREELTRRMDAIVDTYHGGTATVDQLIILRRDLASVSYRVAAFVKEVYGQAGLTYIRRKYRIAESILDARNQEAKAPAMNILEQKAMTIRSVQIAQEEEVWAEAEKEALKSKLDFVKQVLSSMQQEIAYEANEKKNAHFQGTGR